MSCVDGVRLGGAGSGGGQFGVGAGFIGELCAGDHLFLVNRLLSGGKFGACLAELDGGEARRIDAFRIGNSLLGSLQVGGGTGACWRRRCGD